MAKIGQWGQYLTFRVSSSKTLTFQDMQRSADVEIQEHGVAVGKPRMQFVAPNLEEVSFTMEINALQYRKPAGIISTLINAMNSGIYAPLVIGGRVILQKAILTKVDTDYETVIAKGKILAVKVSVTMKEYN